MKYGILLLAIFLEWTAKTRNVSNVLTFLRCFGRKINKLMTGDVNGHQELIIVLPCVDYHRLKD